MNHSTAPFERSHMNKPRGNGNWAFACFTRSSCFAADQTGPAEFFQGTHTEARKAAKAFFTANTPEGATTFATMP